MFMRILKYFFLIQVVAEFINPFLNLFFTQVSKSVLLSKMMYLKFIFPLTLQLFEWESKSIFQLKQVF
jgi:hypothetical protein